MTRDASSPASHVMSVTAGGSNTVAFACVAWGNSAGASVASVTYGGQPMTSAGAAIENTTGTHPEGYAQVFYLVNPPTGSNTLSVSMNGTVSDIFMNLVSFNGVDQNTPVRPGTYQTTTGTTPISMTMTSNPSDLTMTCVNSGWNGTSGTNQTLDGKNTSGLYEGDDDHATTPAASVTHTWGLSAATNVALVGFSIQAAGSVADTQVPSVPANLSGTAISSSAINLSWSPSTDNVGVTGYKIYRNGAQVGTSATNSYSDSGLTASTAYSYTISAYDAAGNNSTQSSSASATTQSAPAQDTTPPSTPMSFSATAVSSSGINLSWIASTDNVGVAGYKIYRNGIQIGTLAANSYSDTGLSASTAYSYTVSAYDAAGNNSAQSSSASATTQVASSGNTITATSCSQTDVQNAINSVANGGTVLVPGPCTPTWSSFITIPSTKGITLNGQGATLANSPSIEVTTNVTMSTRVTNFVFTGAGSDNNGDISFQGNQTDAPYRLDNSTFTNNTAGGATFVVVSGNGTGLIDHNTMTDQDGGEMIHNVGLGAGDSAGWVDSVTPGSPNMVYIEENTFSMISGTNGAGNKAIESYYGSRNVFRDNTLKLAVLDQHGTPGAVWARWWEIYNNTFDESASGSNVGSYIILRGGSGVIWGNSEIGQDVSPLWGISLEVECVNPGQECTGGSGQTYPQAYQDGRGINQNLSPIYIWSNTDQTGEQMNINNLSSAMTAVNRDYYVSTTKPSSMLRQEMSGDTSVTIYNYTPFTYPYPLTANGMPNPSGGGSAPDTTPPSVPTNLSATAVSSSAINLSWTTSSDNVGVSGYKVFRNGTQITTTSSTSYSDTGLSASTNYSYTVSAYDAAGNNSTQSSSASATTQASATPVPGDLNLDHIVNTLDFSLLNSKWLQSYPSYDLFVDGIINSLDYAILSSNWGKTW